MSWWLFDSQLHYSRYSPAWHNFKTEPWLPQCDVGLILRVCRVAPVKHSAAWTFFALYSSHKHLHSSRIVLTRTLIRLSLSLDHPCEQALMNTNVWTPQQQLIILLKGITRLDGIIGTQRTEALGSSLPTVHTGTKV